MGKSYPKILIIGETFQSNSGGGITLSNLFSDWPKEKLANAVDFRDPGMNKDYENIRVYELYNSKFIFNTLSHKYFQPFRSCKISSESKNKFKIKSSIKFFAKKLAFKLLEYSGLKHIIFNYRIEMNFIEWIKAFNPDYIYTQLSSRESINFANKLHNLTNTPIAIHIMDDWPSTISSKGLFNKFWERKIISEFKNLLNKTSVFLSISEYMSEEYYIRYRKHFIPFHNPLDLSIWDNLIDNPPKSNTTFNFLHAGRIGIGITDSLLEIAKAIQEINDENYTANLQIQSTYIDHQFRKKILKFSCVKINPPADYKDIPLIIKSADILVLCNDFDDKGKKYLKYSMPTKASEYMISKVPILIYSDCSSAVYKHAKKNEWAYLVGENNNSILKAGIIDLIGNTKMRGDIAEKAFQFAKKNYDSKFIKEELRKVFKNPI